MKTIIGRELKPGTVVLLPFGKYATVEDVKFGTIYAKVTWKEELPPTRFTLYQEIEVES